MTIEISFYVNGYTRESITMDTSVWGMLRTCKTHTTASWTQSWHAAAQQKLTYALLAELTVTWTCKDTGSSHCSCKHVTKPSAFRAVFSVGTDDEEKPHCSVMGVVLFSVHIKQPS